MKCKLQSIWIYETIQARSQKALLLHLALTDHMCCTDFTPIVCNSRKLLFICIELNISQLCRIAGHVYILLPTVTFARVTRNRQLSIEMNRIVMLVV